MRRRGFLRKGGLYTLGFMGLQTLTLGCDQRGKQARSMNLITEAMHPGFGQLEVDPEGLMNLPPGFTYKIISEQGREMIDGLLVPGLADGMAAFAGPEGKTIVVRNHEISPGDQKIGAFGKTLDRLSKLDPSKLYDYGHGSLPSLGGTTTFVYDHQSGEIDLEYLSLAGTIRNCAGGLTPWNSWISCEENTSLANSKLEKNHGYNFEVPASATPLLVDPIPLTDMGRFNHEAICVDPRTHIAYQTEDRGDGLIYRFLPNERSKFRSGGRLQVLAIKDHPSFDTRNWAELTTEKMNTGQKYEVEWIDLKGVDSNEDDLRYRGFEDGGARFARGEGMWFGQNEAYFACTNGGHLEHGQIFRYIPSAMEGQPGENDAPGTLELFIEPNNIDLLKSCDNLTIAPNGDLVICEDRSTPRIVGVTPKGDIYHIADNVGIKSEFAGATFSPNGQTLFVNIQGPGLTFAIEGPWNKRQELI